MNCLRFFLELLPLTIIFIDEGIPNWTGPRKCVIIQDRGDLIHLPPQWTCRPRPIVTGRPSRSTQDHRGEQAKQSTVLFY
jgi:hypothetical protein